MQNMVLERAQAAFSERSFVLILPVPASRYNQAVYTAWDISYDALKGFAKGKEESSKSEDAKAAL
jgi:hypothetical protein